MRPVPLSADLAHSIAGARSLPERQHTERVVEPASVASTLLLRAAEQGHEPFLVYLPEAGGLRQYTYAEFYAEVRRAAALLEGIAHVRRGDRIATAMHNCDHAVVLTFAAWHLGACVVPLNMAEDDQRLAYILEHARAKALFVLNDYAVRLRPLVKKLSGIEKVVRIGGKASEGEASYEDMLPADDAALVQGPQDVSPDDDALIVYTSGTTGVPKGVTLTQYNLVADAYAMSRSLGLKRGMRTMCVLPVHYANGIVATHVMPLFFGGSNVLVRKFSASRFFETIAKYGVNLASAVPTILQFLLDATPADFDAHRDAPSLKYIVCGAGPLTIDLASRFEDRFNIPIVHGYGLSETTCYACFIPVAESVDEAEHRRWMRGFGFPAVGVPLATNEMAIHDDHGMPQPEDVKGEIVIRGHNVMRGYHDNAEANENAFRFGWFRSGDEGFFRRGPSGQPYFFICGRYKELIIRGGVKISPLEVDEVLNRIHGVYAAMSVGFENAVYGEEVGAYVVRKPGSSVSEEAILESCRAQLPFHARPKVVVFGETFPVTSTGKYKRNTLKPLFVKWKDVQFRDRASG